MAPAWVKIAFALALRTTERAYAVESNLTDSCNNSPYGQCGGLTWQGVTCCPTNYECHCSDDYYCQCIPTGTVDDQIDHGGGSDDTAGSSAYACGSPMLGQVANVKTMYEAWKAQYLNPNYLRSYGVWCVQRLGYDGDCVSEGLGYGMILSAALDDQPTFDALWGCAQNMFDEYGLPVWKFDKTCTILYEKGSATDGELDIALGLLMGANKWPANSAAYMSGAKALINNMMLHDVDFTTMMLKPGDHWGTQCYDASGSKNPIPYNPSYFSPAHMRLFATISGDSRWTSLVTAGYAFMNGKCASVAAPGSGLVPDWTASLTSCSPGSRCMSATRDSGADYYFDAIRTPWRLALDASWTCDPAAIAWVGKLASFFDQKGPANIKQGFYMSGVTLGGTDSRCFISTAATAMIPAQDAATIQEWWSATQNIYSDTGYYCDSLQVLAMTYMAGLMPQPAVLVGANLTASL